MRDGSAVHTLLAELTGVVTVEVVEDVGMAAGLELVVEATGAAIVVVVWGRADAVAVAVDVGAVVEWCAIEL